MVCGAAAGSCSCAWCRDVVVIACLVFLRYFLYLFLTRSTLDIFNCTPTIPSDGHTYLQVGALTVV